MKIGVLESYLGLRFFSSLFFWIIVTVELVYQATVVGLSPFQLVLVGTFLEAATFIFEIPTGIVADAYSRKLSVTVGVVLVGLGFVFEGLIPTFGAVLVAQLIWGFGYTFISGAREAWIADEIGDAHAATAFIKGEQAGKIGTFVGIAASMVLANIDIRIPLIAGGLFYALQAIYITILMPERNFTPVAAGKRETFRSMKKVFLDGIGLIRHNRALSIIFATSIIFGMFSEGWDRLWTPFMIGNFVFPLGGSIKPVVWFGIITMVESLLVIVVTEIVRKRTDFSSHRSVVKSLLVSNALLMVGAVGFGFAAGFPIAVAMYWFAAVFRWLKVPLYNAWINQNAVSKAKATIFSFCSQADAIGQVAGGPILGLIAGYISLRAGIVVAGLVLLPALFFYAYALKDRRPAPV